MAINTTGIIPNPSTLLNTKKKVWEIINIKFDIIKQVTLCPNLSTIKPKIGAITIHIRYMPLE